MNIERIPESRRLATSPVKDDRRGNEDRFMSAERVYRLIVQQARKQADMVREVCERLKRNQPVGHHLIDEFTGESRSAIEIAY